MNLKKYLLIWISLFLLGCGKNNETAVAPTTSPLSSISSLRLSVFASGLEAPVAMVSPRDGTHRLFVLEQRGVIKIIKEGKTISTPFLDITSLVKSGGEQGLLGLAFPPDYASKKYFYVNYTNRSGVGNTVLARYHVSADTNMAERDSGEVLLSITQPFANHNGGQLAFGPDGFLYMGTGDGGSAGDPFNNAQNKNSLLGKILRLDVESNQGPYRVPSGNPFHNEVWAYGLRNPWRFSFDRVTNELYIADVGQDQFEEIDVQSNEQAGLNYGWRTMEGAHCFMMDQNCNQNGLVLPVTEYTHADGDCSVTGGYVYRGDLFPLLKGTYFYGDFCSGRIRGLQKGPTGWESKVLADTPYQISSFGEGEDGTLYFADYASGTIYMISTGL